MAVPLRLELNGSRNFAVEKKFILEDSSISSVYMKKYRIEKKHNVLNYSGTF